jgi:hypothetical protein
VRVRITLARHPGIVGHGTDEEFLIEIAGSAKATTKRNVEGTASMTLSLRLEDTVGE